MPEPRRRAVVAALGLELLAASAMVPRARAQSQGEAVAPDGSGPPPEIRSELPDARLQGSLRLRWFGWHVYDARLWTDRRVTADDYDRAPFALELEYARDLRGAAIAERSIDEMRRLEGFDDTLAEAWRMQLLEAFPDVRRGDRLSGLHRPARPVRFFHNGRATHAVRDDDGHFARLFFGIWLSARNGSPEQRAALLGLPR